MMVAGADPRVPGGCADAPPAAGQKHGCDRHRNNPFREVGDPGPDPDRAQLTYRYQGACAKEPIAQVVMTVDPPETVSRSVTDLRQGLDNGPQAKQQSRVPWLQADPIAVPPFGEEYAGEPGVGGMAAAMA